MRHSTQTLFSQPDGIMEIQTDTENNTPGSYDGNFPVTAQLSDCIIFNGEFRDLNSYPLEQYWAASGKNRPSFITPCNCARGYTAIWHVLDNQLFLLSVDGFYERRVALFGNRSARFTLTSLGSSRGKPVKANWFSGELRVLQWKGAVDDNNTYGLRSRKEMIISVDKGDLVKVAPLDHAQKSLLRNSGMLLRTSSNSRN